MLQNVKSSTTMTSAARKSCPGEFGLNKLKLTSRVLSSESLISEPRRESERAIWHERKLRHPRGGRNEKACEGAPGSLSMPVWPFARAHKSFQSRAIQINSPYMKPVLPRSVCFLPTAASLPYKSFAYNIDTSRRSFFSFGKATTTPQTSATMSSATSFHEFKPLDSM